MNTEFIILTPVYNDWKNLAKLLSKINYIFKNKLKKTFSLIIVDDCSTQKFNSKKLKFSQIKKIKVIKLKNNIGSQRALAVGIKYISLNFNNKFKLIIIDSDGQDNPEGIIKMLKISKQKKDFSIVANRGQRAEQMWFKICYEIYCYLIMLFSFKKLRFGNFSIILSRHLKQLLKNSDLWCALPPAIILNINKIKFVTLKREKRYSGNSKMNFFGLIFHSLKVFSALRKKILLTSLVYAFIIYVLIFDKYQITSLILFIIILTFNISNWYISFKNKEDFQKNFSKIVVKKI